MSQEIAAFIHHFFNYICYYPSIHENFIIIIMIEPKKQFGLKNNIIIGKIKKALFGEANKGFGGV